MSSRLSLSRWASIIIRILVVFGILLLWETLPRLGLFSEFSVPRFSKVAFRILEIINPTASAQIIPAGFYTHLYITLFEIGAAFIITLSIGLPLGFVIGGFKLITKVYEPLVYFMYAFPSVVLYPLIVVVIGFGPQSKILFGFFLGLFPLILNSIAALRNLRPSYILVAQSFGCNTIQLFVKIILPASLPLLVAAIRLALGFNVIGVLFGEIISSSAGLGFVITTATYKLDASTEYAAIVIALVITYAIVEAVRLVEKLVSRSG